MGKIHKILEAAFAKHNESNEDITVKYFAGEDEKPSNKHTNVNLELIANENCDQIGENVFLKWKCEDEKIRTHLRDNYRAAIIKYAKTDEEENSFVMLPVIPHEGNTLESKMKMLKHIVGFLKQLGIKRKVNICVMAGTRKSWAKCGSEVERLFRESEILIHNIELDEVGKHVTFVNTYTHNGTEYDLSFEINEAVKHADVIIPINGAAGNSFLRFFRFMSADSYELLSVPWFVYDQKLPVGEGGFRNEDDLSNHIKAAVAWQYLRNNRT